MNLFGNALANRALSHFLLEALHQTLIYHLCLIHGQIQLLNPILFFSDSEEPYQQPPLRKKVYPPIQRGYLEILVRFQIREENICYLSGKEDVLEFN